MKLRCYTSYARICVYMQLDRALLDAVSLLHDDYEWIQLLDYEHVPFHCRRCHAHGHLFRDYPLTAQTRSQDNGDKEEADGFTKVPSRRRNNKKSTQSGKKPSPYATSPSTSNSFTVLDHSDPQSDNTLVVRNPSAPSDPSSTQPNPSTSGPS